MATANKTTTSDPALLATGTVTGFSSPIYRGALNHGATAELQEGFRVLSGGQKVNLIDRKDLCAVMQSAGLHTSEEELQDLLRVVHQDERTDKLEFSEFLTLMTKEVDAQMLEEMKTAFLLFDKEKKGTVTTKQFTEMFVTMGERSTADELDELLTLADPSEDSETIDYSKFIAELAIHLNKM